MNRHFLIPGLALVSLLLVIGCATPARAGNSVVHVTANEWNMTTDSSSVQAGQITLEVVNQGLAPHEVVLLKTDLATDALKIKANGAEVDESASGEVMGEVEDIESGQTKSLTLNLAPGRYVLTCNVLGHYKAGMVTVLEVTK